MDTQNLNFNNAFVCGDDYLFSIEVVDFLLTMKSIKAIFQVIDQHFPVNQINYLGHDGFIHYQLDEIVGSEILMQHLQIGESWYELNTSLFLKNGLKTSVINVENSITFNYHKFPANFFSLGFYSYLFINRYRIYDYKNQKYIYFNNTIGARKNRKNMRDVIIGIEKIIDKPIDSYFSQELPRNSIYNYGILENAKIIT